MELSINKNQMEEIAGLTSEYPFAYHRPDYSEWHVPWHWHEEVEFNYVVSGKMMVKTTDKEYIFHEGEAFYINSNVLAAMEKVEGEPRCLTDSYLFHPVFLSGHFRSIFETKYVEPVIHNKGLDVLEIRGNNDIQKEMLRKLRQVPKLQNEENFEFKIRNIFSEIWLLLLEEMKNMDYPVKRENQDRIQSMISYIQQHYQDKITLEEIASSAAVGTRECLRCFQKNIQKTPFEYLLDYRIERAENLLLTTNDSIVDIALQCGFSNSAYFCKVFKELRHITPGKFRSVSHSNHLP